MKIFSPAIPIYITTRLKTFMFLENASRRCLAGGVWESLTDYQHCLNFPPPGEDVASDISLYIYLVGRESHSQDITPIVPLQDTSSPSWLSPPPWLFSSHLGNARNYPVTFCSLLSFISVFNL